MFLLIGNIVLYLQVPYGSIEGATESMKDSGELVAELRNTKTNALMKVDLSWAQYRPGVAQVTVQRTQTGEANVCFSLFELYFSN